MKRLLLCYHSDYAAEVHVLAEELRLRGISPWLDTEGGFTPGQRTPAEARRALREDTWGLLLYASPGALGRPFIRDVELRSALDLADSDHTYSIIPVPRGLGFQELARQSQSQVGDDLTLAHGCRAFQDLPEACLTPEEVRPRSVTAARDVLAGYLRDLARSPNGRSDLPVLVTSKVEAPPLADEVLHIDAAPTLRGRPAPLGAWERVMRGLLDVRDALAASFRRPQIHIRGSFHLSLGGLLGRVFAKPSTFGVSVEQGRTIWPTETDQDTAQPVATSLRDGAPGVGSLFVEVSITQHVRGGVRGFTMRTGLEPCASVRVVPPGGPSRDAVRDAGVCHSMAEATARAVREACAQRYVQEIHLFMASPQAFAVMLGRELTALCPIQLYEFDGLHYAPSIRFSSADVAP
jgi:hypothetical protein